MESRLKNSVTENSLWPLSATNGRWMTTFAPLTVEPPDYAIQNIPTLQMKLVCASTHSIKIMTVSWFALERISHSVKLMTTAGFDPAKANSCTSPERTLKCELSRVFVVQLLQQFSWRRRAVQKKKLLSAVQIFLQAIEIYIFYTSEPCKNVAKAARQEYFFFPQVKLFSK